MTSVQLSGPERAFLAGSVAEHDREARETQDRERRAVTAERRQARRSHQLLAVGLVAVLVTGLAVFGTAQWRSAVDAKRDVEDLLAVDGLVRASEDAGQNDPELALLLAMQAVRLTADDGYATGAAVDAVHFGLQELGVRYEVDSETPVAVRAGPNGLFGVYALPPAELMRLAESAVERSLSDDECRTFLSQPCPAEADIPIDLELQGGLEAYGVRTGPDALRGTTVTIAAPYWVEEAATAGSGLYRELAAFSDRTGIAVEVIQGDVEAFLGVNLDELSRRPDVVTFGGVIPDWIEARDRHQHVHRAGDAALRLRRLPVELRVVRERGTLTRGRGAGACIAAQSRRQGTGLLSKGQVRGGRVRDPHELGSAASRSPIGSWPMAGRRGASLSRRATGADGQAPT